MFNQFMVISSMGWIIPRGDKMKAALYAYAYGASLKTVRQQFGISKRRLKKAINAGNW